MFMPFQVLGVWFRGLFAVAILATSSWLLYAWYSNRVTYVAVERPVSRVAVDSAGINEVAQPSQPSQKVVETRPVEWEFGLNKATAYLLAGLLLGIWGLAGRWISPTMLRRRGDDEPHDSLRGTVISLQRPDGERLHVESYGSEDAPPLILTHGWGLDSHAWYYVKKELADRYRLIVWDLPGLGQSTAPEDNNYSLDSMASDLNAVLGLAGNQPAILVGHSIGGMITLTFCRLFPEKLGKEVCGLAIVQSTYTNPVRTTKGAGLLTAIQKPVLEPLCHLMVWTAPLVWVLNWLSYLNGSAHRSTERSAFSGRETRGQLDYLARYYVTAWPAVLARGQLAMFRYNASDILARIPVPCLIVSGDKDNTCKPEASAVMSATIPRATSRTLSPARHCGFFEDHQVFSDALKEFVTGCFRARAKLAS